MPQSPSKKAPLDLTQLSQMPSATLSYFSESHQLSEVSSLSKMISVFGKVEVAGRQTWSVVGLSHLGAFMFCKKLH